MGSLVVLLLAERAPWKGLVRRAHSRINQATLEKEVWDWLDICSGRPSSPQRLARLARRSCSSGLSGFSGCFGLFGFSGSSNKTNKTDQMN